MAEIYGCGIGPLFMAGGGKAKGAGGRERREREGEAQLSSVVGAHDRTSKRHKERVTYRKATRWECSQPVLGSPRLAPADPAWAISPPSSASSPDKIQYHARATFLPLLELGPSSATPSARTDDETTLVHLRTRLNRRFPLLRFQYISPPSHPPWRLESSVTTRVAAHSYCPDHSLITGHQRTTSRVTFSRSDSNQFRVWVRERDAHHRGREADDIFARMATLSKRPEKCLLPIQYSMTPITKGTGVSRHRIILLHGRRFQDIQVTCQGGRAEFPGRLIEEDGTRRLPASTGAHPDGDHEGSLKYKALLPFLVRIQHGTISLVGERGCIPDPGWLHMTPFANQPPYRSGGGKFDSTHLNELPGTHNATSVSVKQGVICGMSGLALTSKESNPQSWRKERPTCSVEIHSLSDCSSRMPTESHLVTMIFAAQRQRLAGSATSTSTVSFSGWRCVNPFGLLRDCALNAGDGTRAAYTIRVTCGPYHCVWHVAPDARVCGALPISLRANTLEAIIVAQNSTAPHPPCVFPALDYTARAPCSAALMQSTLVEGRQTVLALNYDRLWSMDTSYSRGALERHQELLRILIIRSRHAYRGHLRAEHHAGTGDAVSVWVAQPMKSQHIDTDLTRSRPPRALPEPNAELRSSSASGDSKRARRFSTHIEVSLFRSETPKERQ
ncbi:hypothetical protein BC826DRAFT_1177572 [Russula brevipes]|nr:hypothetical protein BC826DRAFT_1177572 [Russula brevipes]